MELGERIIVKTKEGSYAATVLFIGPIVGKDGEWAGVEWDDPARGRNDGSDNGTQYFSCRRSETGGSFVKLSKLRPGISLVEAVKERYAPEAADLSDMSMLTVGKRSINVELAGSSDIMAKLRQMNLLNTINMSEQGIARPGDVAVLSGLLTSLTHISMADNLIGNWEHISKICAALESTHTFDFSSNRPQFHSPFHAPPLPHVRILILNSCHLSWSDVLAIAPSLPCLEELYLGGNGIAEVSQPGPDLFQCLHTLDLQKNQLSGWQSITCLSALPALSHLQLSENDIRTVEGPGGGFTALSTLLLAKCGIAEWRSVDVLAEFPALLDVRLSANAVLHASAMGGRYECIARAARITHLNGSAVGKHERRDSEIRYLRTVAQEIADAGDQRGRSIAAAHPRLAELELEYGKAEVQSRAHGLQDGVPLAEGLVSFTVVHHAAPPAAGGTVPEAACSEADSRDIALPMSTTVCYIKLLCQTFFGVDVNLQKLSLVKGGSDPENIGTDGSLDLIHHNFESGCVVRVAAADSDEMWSHLGGTTQEVVPAHWLLPPESRPELSALMAL